MFVPTKVFLTSGTGNSKYMLGSFEIALRGAGIAPFNLVKVSSIFPRNAQLITKEEGLKYLEGKEGAILHVVLSEKRSNEADRLLSCGIGIARPSDTKMYGYLSEIDCYGKQIKVLEDECEDLAASMLYSVLKGKDLDLDTSWDDKKEMYKSDNDFFDAESLTCCIHVKEGCWTTALVAAVLLP